MAALPRSQLNRPGISEGFLAQGVQQLGHHHLGGLPAWGSSPDTAWNSVSVVHGRRGPGSPPRCPGARPRAPPPRRLAKALVPL